MPGRSSPDQRQDCGGCAPGVVLVLLEDDRVDRVRSALGGEHEPGVRRVELVRALVGIGVQRLEVVDVVGDEVRDVSEHRRRVDVGVTGVRVLDSRVRGEPFDLVVAHDRHEVIADVLHLCARRGREAAATCSHRFGQDVLGPVEGPLALGFGGDETEPAVESGGCPDGGVYEYGVAPWCRHCGSMEGMRGTFRR